MYSLKQFEKKNGTRSHFPHAFVINYFMHYFQSCERKIPSFRVRNKRECIFKNIILASIPMQYNIFRLKF